MIEVMNNDVPAEGEIFIYLDEQGIADLQAIIDMARRTEHEHVFDETWGIGRYGLKVSNPIHSHSQMTIVVVPAGE